MAKGIGNGTALGAVTTRPEIAEALAGKIHFNTFGGNPVQMSQASAVLDVIDSEGIQDNARVVGSHLKSGLVELQQKHPIMGEVRGMGLLLGVELVRDRATKEPADDETTEVLEQARVRGLLLGRGGFYGNTLRIAPPMCLSKDDADFLLDCLDDVFGPLGSEGPVQE
jgi:alanine-glyoxylate transaminase/(R)-3-amino-2-methylpropionate-pyruvate transaminase